MDAPVFQIVVDESDQVGNLIYSGCVSPQSPWQPCITPPVFSWLNRSLIRKLLMEVVGIEAVSSLTKP
jgi:hypothetical protein